MSYTVGINLVETDGRVSRAVQPAETSVAGFVIRSARGPVGDAVVGQAHTLSDVVTVTSWDQFVARFGGPEGPFVYIAVPLDRIGEVEGLVPLESVEITGRVRIGASSLTGAPIVDLIRLDRGREVP